MVGYKSGAIAYSAQSTLTWAAKIVDIAPHYNDLTKDISAGLERYFETYGPGWFFYEAPLKMHPSIMPKMGTSIAIRRGNTFYALEGYYINQGFWKHTNFVRRMPPFRLGASQLTPESPYFARDTEGRLDCGSPGLKLAFKSMLNSGTLTQLSIRKTCST
jgi:hypothetical protein